MGTVIGPMVGGWLLSSFWWGSVFLINLPIGVAGLIAAAFLVPNSRARQARRLDWAGALLSVTAVASALCAIATAGSVPLTRLSADASVYAGLLPGFVVASLGLGAVFVTATTTALGMIDHHEAGLASGIVNTFHEVGGSIGVAVAPTIAASGIESGSVGGFTDAFTACAIAATASAAVALGLVPRGKPQLTGGPHVH